MRNKIFTFIFTFIIWVIFAGRLSLDVIIIGTGAAVLTSILFSDMFIRTSNHKVKWYSYPARVVRVIMFIPVFFYEALIAALKVSSHVFEKNPSFSPGIVKVKTNLTNVTAITILANLITLTPGTLTLDFDKTERAYYIHWIDVTTREEVETRKKIIERFERWLDVIFK